MGATTNIGINPAKNVFRVHGAAKQLLRPQFIGFAASRDRTDRPVTAKGRWYNLIHQAKFQWIEPKDSIH